MAYNRFLGQNGFRGVDFTSHPSLVHPDRLADALNVWKDYKSGQGSAIETFPGYRKIAQADGEVYGIFRYRSSNSDYLLAHIGERIYYFDTTENSLKPIGSAVAKLAKNKSHGFQFGNAFYIVDGEHYVKIVDSSTGLSFFYHSTNQAAYIPTTFINGVEHEQRNMLVDQEKQQYTPLQIDGAYGGHEFEYDYDDANSVCFITKCTSSPNASSVVITPSKVTHGNKVYKVIGIYKNAFYENLIIRKVILSDQPRIGIKAFYKCQNLEEVVMLGAGDYPGAPQTEIREISESAFEGCSNLSSVYVSPGAQERSVSIALNGFLNAGVNTTKKKTTIIVVDSTSTSPTIQIIGDGAQEVLVGSTTIVPKTDTDIHLPLYSKCTAISSVYIENSAVYANNGALYYTTTTEKDGDTDIITEVIIKGDTISVLGKTATVTVDVDSKHFYASKYTPFLSAQSGYAGTAQAAVLGCTICAQFDGRVFFTGNPALPNTVFYTHRDNTGHNNPFYIGTYNYFDTGIGQTPNTAMIATGSNLIVFKGNTIQDGAINLYQGVDGTDNTLPRYYVRQQGLAGVGCLGAACNFADDPVFISKRGLDAVGLQTVNLERSVQHRSTNVDRKLTSEDLAHAQMTEWEGYLVLLVPGGRVYLADSRQLFTNAAGYMEYEWYFLDDIGSYANDEPVYAFSSVLPVKEVGGKPLNIYPNPDTIVSGTVGSEGDGDNWVGYVDIDEVRYSVYKTGEMGNGDFYPASCIVGIDDYLIFGTENGAICVFNTDKRGTMEANDQGIDTRDIIPREYFSHMEHRYLSTIILALENAGVPNMAKNTVKRTVVLKAKDIFGSVFKWNVRTDRKVFGTNPDVAMAKGEISNAVTDLDFLEFQYINFDTSYDGALIVLNEKKKRYVEKQYAFFSDGYCRPFGIYHIAYQYEIQGKVKNR